MHNMKRNLLGRIFAFALVGFSTITMAVGTFAWFVDMGLKTRDEVIDGEVRLRSYFYAGDGSYLHPFEIVRPVHLYNFSYLQNLGVFSSSKYFRIGHSFSGDNETFRCLDNSGNEVDYLDMDDTTITTIGNEATPFIGNFNGNGLPVRNLKVRGNPDDVGFFGYVGYEGEVEGLVLDEAEIKSIGYSNVESSDMYGLFNPDVDEIFEKNAHRFRSNTSLAFYDIANSKAYGLKTKTENSYTLNNDADHIGLNGIGINEINKSSSLVDTYYYKGYFVPTFPTMQNDPFTYYCRASSPIIESGTLTVGETEYNGLLINQKLLADSTGVGSFNSNDDKAFSLRISLLASYHDASTNLDYARVIQTYTIMFHSNGSNGFDDTDHYYSMTLFCDYIYQDDTSKINTHHHGNNIGYLAGHLDGRMKHCYVYNSTLSFDGDTQDMNTVSCETETGLIGEIGVNIVNHLDPEYGNSDNEKDTGVMNFTRIYSGIRRDYSVNNVVKSGHYTSPEANYVCYDAQTKDLLGNDMPLFGAYEKYLMKHSTFTTHYVTHTSKTIDTISTSSDLWTSDTDPDKHATTWHNYKITSEDLAANTNKLMNSVTFGTNGVIEDETELGTNRGMGVFKVVLPKSSESDHHYLNFGKSRIVKGSEKTEVFFSTAEYDHVKSNNTGSAWGSDPYRPFHTPEYTDENSFEYPFSRDYNYCFRLNLADMNKNAEGYNYMWNCENSPNKFLSNYLKSILVDKYGTPITKGINFGFRFQMKDANMQTISLNSLSSYMPVGKPGDAYTHNGKKYPSNAIVFSINTGADGANVSVVGNGNDITIYKFYEEGGTLKTTPLYTMRATNKSATDFHRYFDFNVETGIAGTESEQASTMGDNDALYGHIFHIKERGDYMIGIRPGAGDNDKANIYFLAVQGQEDGEMGTSEDLINIESHELDNVDFLTSKPTLAKYKQTIKLAESGTLDRAYFTFNADFNGEGNEISTNIYSGSLNLNFTASPKFVTRLFTHCYNSETLTNYYYVNNNAVTTKDKTHNV